MKNIWMIGFLCMLWAAPLAAQDDGEEDPEVKTETKKGKKEKPVKEEEPVEDGQKQDDCPETENANALKYFKKSQDKKKFEYKERMEFLKKAMEEDPEDARINLEYARHIVITMKNRDASFASAGKYYEKVIAACPNLHSDPYYYLAIIAWEAKNYKDCKKYSKLYMDFKSEDEKKYDQKYAQFMVDMKSLYKWSVVYDELYGNPVPYDPNLVKGLSSERPEYLPVISPDNTTALFTRQVKPQTKDAGVDIDRIIERFMVSKRQENGDFDNGNWMPDPFNRGTNEGGATMTIDNKTLYFTICKDEGGPQAECDIWYCINVKGKWGEIKKVPNLNTKDKWDSQPSVSADGNTIYFASDRPGGLGGTDIWYVQRDQNGLWGQPKNCGPKINTNGDEKAPFMHSDSYTLYFSSGPSSVTLDGGWPGVGGMDIYYSKMDEKGNWMEPKNIGIPINTKGDEVGLIVSTDGRLAYFASDDPRRTKNKSMGGYDIYAFDLYEKARPEKVVFLEGELKGDNGKPLKDAVIEIKDSQTKKTVKAVYDTTDGKYRGIIADKGNDILVKVETPKHSFTSTLISKKDSVQSDKLITKVKVPAPKPVVTGEKYSLSNIYYKTGSAELDKKSLVVLEEFAAWLKKNPNLKIEIHGHTDNVGDRNDNMALSKDRAFTVMETLISFGVKKEQITGFKGFGPDAPLTSNDTETDRAKNRRTEFFVIGN
ncbi:MAG: PD40 domain-containing protein [Bacteroidia bacterium]|nr:PD40 domain-containing protein [Bacteroidia bacterium]